MATVERLVGVYSNLSGSRVIFDFLGSWQSGEAVAGDEAIAAAWVSKAAAEEMIEHPGYRQRLRQLLAFDGRVLLQSYTTSPFVVRAQQWL